MMQPVRHSLVAAICLSFPLYLSAQAGTDSHFISVAKDSSGYHFSQEGKRFYSFGVTTCIPTDKPPKDRPDKGWYDGPKSFGGDAEAWARATANRLNSWGLNTLGGWAAPVMEKQPTLYFTKVLGFGYGGNIRGNRLMDVWSPEYAAAVVQEAEKTVAPLANEPRLLGWFTNNELNWHGDFGWQTDANDSLLDKYLALPAGAAGRAELLRWLPRHFQNDFAKFREAFACSATDWKELTDIKKAVPVRSRAAQIAKFAWCGVVAERYFSLCEEAIRRHDRQHLILGARFAGSAPLSVLQAQARHCDVLSVNYYNKEGHAPLGQFDRLFSLTGKPLLVTEFGWRAVENRSGCGNTHGVDVTVPTQQERAVRFDRYFRQIMTRPYALGMHWFQHADQPPGGRFDGEDSNYGLVDLQNQPYEEVVEAWRRLTAEAASPNWKREAFPAASTPKGWPENEALALSPGKLSVPLSLLPPAARQDLVAHIADFDHGAKLTLQPAGKGWTAKFSCGTGWGVLPSFRIPAESKAAGSARLRVRFQAPAGASCRVILVESGANAKDHRGRGEADGESFSCDNFAGAGVAQEEILFLEDFHVRWEYGNQKGNRRLDLDGLESIGFAIDSKNLAGELKLMDLSFLPQAETGAR